MKSLLLGVLAVTMLAIPLPAVAQAASPVPADEEMEPAADLEGLGGTWRRMRPAPFATVDAPGGWTGTELVVLDPERRRDAAAYDPATDRWRTIARPPWLVDAGNAAHWTGTELLLVDGRAGERGLAAYDPATDRWRVTAPAPLATITSSVWAGDDLVVISGSDHTVATYRPATDSWRRLPPLPMSAQTPGEPPTLHLAGEQVLALTTTAAEPGPTLTFVPLDLASWTWGARSAGPLVASAASPVWTDDSFVFLSEPVDTESPSGAGPRDGTYDPASGTWTITGNPCGLDTTDAVWTGALVLDLARRRAVEPHAGRCYAIPLPPWPERAGALHAWTGSEALEFAGSTRSGSPPRPDGTAYRPVPVVGALGAVVDKPARPVRIRVPSLGIDLPVISTDRRVRGATPGYPACDVALYWSYFDLPGTPGTTWILAHSQEGMFRPLLEQARSGGPGSLLGREVELQLRDGRLFRYRIFRVKPRSDSYDLRIARQGRREGEQRLVLQTSTGVGAAPKLEVAARLVEVGTTDRPRPRPRPRACG